jgi:FkbM family methyltransferase
MRKILEQLMPPIVWEFAKRIPKLLRARYGAPDIKEDIARARELEKNYRKNNEGLKSDTIMFRPGLKMRIHPDTRRTLENFCYILPSVVTEMDCFLDATRGKERLLDIGALHGGFSLAFALQASNRKALAVDASPIAFARLLYNIKKNDLSNITPIECAISEKVGNLAMHYEWEHAVAAGTNSGNSMIDVPMTTGDNLCQYVDFQPDVIKIDVEGHEIKVLKGLKETIKKHSPLIFLEVHPKRIEEEGDSISFLEHYFDEIGYSAQLVSGDRFPLSSFRILKCFERLLLSKTAEQDATGNA